MWHFSGLFGSNWHKNDTRITTTHKSNFKAEHRHVKLINERNLVFETLFDNTLLKNKGQLNLRIIHGIVIFKF